MRRDLKELEQKTGYAFREFSLLRQAMTHSSYVNERNMEKHECNERLEFLGDAVLELVSSEFLFHEHPTMPEGKLTRTRASMVCEPSLALCARSLEIGAYLLLGKGEEATGGRGRDSIISDVMEAIIGAIYLDSGFERAEKFIMDFILSDLENKQLFYDSKSILQERVQKTGGVVHYELVEETGPEHDKQFVVRALINNRAVSTGIGRSKKAAEQQAAYEVLLKEEK